jgi:Tol biopolymer transport system component
LTPVPITTLPGSEYFPSFSPDGNHVAFTWINPGQSINIYAKVIGSEAVRQVTDTAKVELGPAWSPDGRWIAFVRGERFRTPVREVTIAPALGGPERTVGQTEPDWGPFLAWTPESDGLIYSSCKSPEPCRLMLVWLDTLHEQALTSPPKGPGGDTAPAVSPDGRQLLFVRRRGGHTATIFAQQLSEDWRPVGEPQPLTREDVFATAPTWAADGGGFFYMTGDVGMSMRLWRGSMNVHADPKLLGALGDSFFEPGLSAHGNRVIAMDLRIDMNIRRISLLDVGSEVEPRSLTESNRIDRFPHYSPDGGRIVFESTRYGGSELFVMNADGTNVVQLTTSGLQRAREPRWSRDGEKIAFVLGERRGNIYSMRALGGEPEQITSGPANDLLPSWSPDGEFLYFTSDRSGRYEIWKIASEGGEPVQLTFGGAYRPIASADGRFVYYTVHAAGASHGAPLFRVGANGGGEEEVFDTPVFHPENFDVVGNEIYYATAIGDTGVKAVRVFALLTGEDRELALMGETPNFGFSVSPARDALLFTQVDSHECDLVMFEVP